MKRRAVFAVIGVTALLSTSACENESTNPTPQPLNLAGTWNGSFVLQGGPLTARWVATQTGSDVTGPITLTGQNATVNGTMTGTLSGTHLTANVSVPAGAFAGLPTCSMTGTGGLTAAASSISGTINTTWTQACVGTVSAFATQTGQMSLTK
jgi:hypothetical protein